MSTFEKIASIVNQFPEGMKAGMRKGFADMEKSAAMSPEALGALLGGGAGALGGGLYGGLGEGGSLGQAIGYGLGGGALGAGLGAGIGSMSGGDSGVPYSGSMPTGGPKAGPARDVAQLAYQKGYAAAPDAHGIPKEVSDLGPAAIEAFMLGMREKAEGPTLAQKTLYRLLSGK